MAPASSLPPAVVPAPLWFVYLLECADGSIYTGIARDVAARYAAHASGKGARYTRAHRPARLLASVAYPDRSTAAKAEYRIKQLSAAAKRELVAQLASGVSAAPVLANDSSRTAPAARAPDSRA